MSGWAMTLQRRWLATQGFDVQLFSFDTLGTGLREHAHRLAAQARESPGNRVHFVGHSLGGLVILHTLRTESGLPPGRAVLLGSPVCGSVSARSLTRCAWGRAVIGRPLSEWFGQGVPAANWPREIGVVAGDRGSGLGRVVARLDGPNDGAVLVRETRLPGLADHIVLPVSHSGMLVSRRVACGTGRFLQTGRFNPLAVRSA